MHAASLSIPVARFLEQPRRGSVLATFPRSIYLDLNGAIVAVVARELLNGPLNIVLAGPAPLFDQLALGSAVTASMDRLHIEGRPVIALSGASLWDPAITPWTPDQLPRVTQNLDILIGRVMVEAPADHLAHPRIEHAMATVRSALAMRSPSELVVAAAGLAGLGGGLTPTGDDVLVGVLVALAALPDRSAQELRTAVREGTVGRTTRISEAYLDAATRGEASEAWQTLLAALGGDDRQSVVDAGRRILAFGETSGADMLTGFLLAMQALTPVHMGGH